MDEAVSFSLVFMKRMIAPRSVRRETAVTNRSPDYLVGTTSTGTGDFRITPADTLPTTRSNSFPRPCDPTTITSAPTLSASPRIVSIVGPWTSSAWA